MIVSRAPLRFSLGGGGSDLPAYYQRFGGFVISAAIDRYVYVTANKRFRNDIRLAYSETELVQTVAEIRHKIFKAALEMTGIVSSIELTSVAELPANSGLGSSSSFTVALLNALHTYKREFVSSQKLAEEACELEMVRLGKPIGKQDQYIAAYGNVTLLRIDRSGHVEVEPVAVRPEVLEELERNLLIAYTGIERPAVEVLAEQGSRFANDDPAALGGMHEIQELGRDVHRLLLRGTIDDYGALLAEHWRAKRKLASKVSDARIDGYYEEALRAGALGGKLMGAGGGGFFMFYVQPASRRRLWERLAELGLEILPFRFDMDGARIVANLHRS
jgi:D-glycero-alpha-D-manno-heptose-7-phosphate kinase